MLYTYRCEECKEEIDIDKGMMEDKPKHIYCDSCKGLMYRVFNASGIIPDHMKATTDNTIRYDKKKKHLY